MTTIRYHLGPQSRRVYDALRQAIDAGQYASGSRLPAHRELAARFDVAPLTLRQALAVLEEEGLVVRRQGQGTFIRSRSPTPARREPDHLAAIIATQQEIATSELDPRAVMSLIAARAQELTGADGAVIELAEGDDMVYTAASGTAANYVGLRLKLAASLSGQCVRTGEILRCDDAETDLRVDRDACRRVGARSLIVVPLHHHRRVVGVLKVLSPAPDTFDDQDVRTLQLLSGLIAATMSRAAEAGAKQALLVERTAANEALEKRVAQRTRELEAANQELAARTASLRESEARYRQMFQGNQAIKLVIDPQSGAIVDANPAACAFYGYRLDVLRAMNIGEINALSPRELNDEMARAASEERSYFLFRHRLATGEVRDVEVHSGPVETAGQRLLYSIIHDITERRRAEEALKYRALHDALTDLPNRTLLQDRLQHAIRSTRRNRLPLALLVLDLDGFKEVNDTFGHRVGDLLLQQVGHRLQSVLRDSDTVARFGGDEFAVLLPGADMGSAALVADKMLAALPQPFAVEGQDFSVEASIGIALCPDHGEEASLLIQHADVAMYLAKRDRGGHALYDPREDEHSPERFALSVQLREAIERDQLLLHYQPKVHLRTGCVEHVEALVRWQHPERGFIPPDTFIPLAERTGLIQTLSVCVLRRALEQCRRWQKAGLDIRIAVNLSARNLHDPRLPETILGLLAAQDLQPDKLVVELTESAVMSDPFRAIGVLTCLHDAGVKISIDDFGTGYSSLGYLKRLPVDEIKIDRSFVTDMTTNENDRRIVRATISLGHDLGLRTVAEGVEDQEAYDLLATMGCDMAQGYYLSRPLPAEECTWWLQRQRHGASPTSRRATDRSA